ncbi:MAG: nitrite/sulfite reductase [Rhodocyclaceae bacterium]|nr:nitrite/sulfite reductase [Rhodocyclaceae bacterium]
MYRYNDIDRRIVRERVAQFRDQTRRYLAGELTEDEFRPLRLQNGIYIQRHGPMFRIAIPYGHVSSKQLRMLARITRTYDRGVGHFSTRHNLQLNWVRLDQIPDILAELAKVDMHAIQTSGNCVRNTTIDPLAGVSAQEVADPRPWAEIVRQWSTLNPEFAYLPRKFKIAFSGGPDDGANVRMHDLGFQLVRDAGGELGFRVWVGGGLGRTPILGEVVRPFLPWRHLLTYAEAILRVYNLHGRRDNAFKARIKILVKALGIAEFARQVDAEWEFLKDSPSTLSEAEAGRIAAQFESPDYETLPRLDASFEFAKRRDREFAAWVAHNVHAHRVPGYAAATLSLKAPGRAPGDATAAQMELVADLAERFGFAEVRVAQTQNLVLPDVRLRDLFMLWQLLRDAELATPTVGRIADITACPGGDFCALANARSIPLAQAIQARFADLAVQDDIGELKLNISGCMNACGHHHVGHIGLLGVDKQGEEFYQITLGGAWGLEASLGSVIGPAVARDEVPATIARLVDNYRMCRRPHERFIDTFKRLGADSFRTAAYGAADNASNDYERETANG